MTLVCKNHHKTSSVAAVKYNSVWKSECLVDSRAKDCVLLCGSPRQESKLFFQVFAAWLPHSSLFVNLFCNLCDVYSPMKCTCQKGWCNAIYIGKIILNIGASFSEQCSSGNQHAASGIAIQFCFNCFVYMVEFLFIVYLCS